MIEADKRALPRCIRSLSSLAAAALVACAPPPLQFGLWRAVESPPSPDRVILVSAASDAPAKVVAVLQERGYPAREARDSAIKRSAALASVRRYHEHRAVHDTWEAAARRGAAAAPPELSPETIAYLQGVNGRRDLYAFCSAFSLEKSFARTSHWECEIWDLASGAVVYSGVGETTNAGLGAIATSRGSLRRAFAALPVVRP